MIYGHESLDVCYVKQPWKLPHKVQTQLKHINLKTASPTTYKMTTRGLILQASMISKRQLHVISRSKTNIKPASPTPLEARAQTL